MQLDVLAGLFDELDKIATRRGMAVHLQTRSGIRPIRAHNLVGRDSNHQRRAVVENQGTTQQPDLDPGIPPERDVTDAGPDKTASNLSPRQKKLLEHAADARPYVVGAVKAGIPAALFGKIMAGEGPKGSHAARVLGIAGAALGAGNEYVQRWAEKNKRMSVAKKLLAPTPGAK